MTDDIERERQFGYIKVRYRGLRKNTVQMTLFALSEAPRQVRFFEEVPRPGACLAAVDVSFH